MVLGDIYANIYGINIDGIHGTPSIAAPWIPSRLGRPNLTKAPSKVAFTTAYKPPRRVCTWPRGHQVGDIPGGGSRVRKST